MAYKVRDGYFPPLNGAIYKPGDVLDITPEEAEGIAHMLEAIDTPIPPPVEPKQQTTKAKKEAP